MEKQRDKAARRMQRKADRAAGITSDEPDDEFGLADGLAEGEGVEAPEADGTDSEETPPN